jgi:hypothetical protein
MPCLAASLYMIELQGVYTGAPYHNAEKEQIALLTVEETQPNDRKNNHVILPFWE